MPSNKHWSLKELRSLQRAYSSTANARLAQLFGRTVRAVLQQAQRMGLEKDRRRLRRMGRENRMGWRRGKSQNS